jgi:hypothetical protein
MRLAIVCVLVPLLAGCASRLAGASNEELVRDLVEIRPWDGHTGFGTPEGPKSYGWEAKEILVERKAAAVPALVAALKDPSLDDLQKSLVRGAVADLGLYGRDAVPALVEELKTSDTRKAWQVCFAMNRIGPAAQAAVPDLVALLEERGDEVVTPGFTVGDIVVAPNRLRTIVAYTLGSIRGHAEPALPVLAKGALQTEDVEYRRACRQAMRDILGPAPVYGRF